MAVYNSIISMLMKSKLNAAFGERLKAPFND